MEPSHGKKRKRSFSDEKERKAHGNMEVPETDSRDVKLEEANSPNNAIANESTELEKQNVCWPDSLTEAQLDLLVSIKKLAMERLTSIDEERVQEMLPASVLRTIGILMEELVKDHVRKMVCVHRSSESREVPQDLQEDSTR